MDRQQKTYTIYKVTSPIGHIYVGYTSMSIKERWQNHKKRALAGEAPLHPFYNEIRKYGAESFSVLALCTTHNRQRALKLEEKYIAETPQDLSLNLSKGGVNDASEGGRIFWERLNADPEKRAEFIKKLSETKKANDHTDYAALIKAQCKWRKENPKEAYKIAYRGIRIANKKAGRPAPGTPKVDSRPLKERLMHRHKLNEVKKQYVTEVWANRSDDEKAEISRKISEAHKNRNASLSEDERRQATAKARASIDKEKQGQASSRGLKKWWEDLRKDPERYSDYISRRTQTQRERRQANENV